MADSRHEDYVTVEHKGLMYWVLGLGFHTFGSRPLFLIHELCSGTRIFYKVFQLLRLLVRGPGNKVRPVLFRDCLAPNFRLRRSRMLHCNLFDITETPGSEFRQWDQLWRLFETTGLVLRSPDCFLNCVRLAQQVLYNQLIDLTLESRRNGHFIVMLMDEAYRHHLIHRLVFCSLVVLRITYCYRVIYKQKEDQKRVVHKSGHSPDWIHEEGRYTK